MRSNGPSRRSIFASSLLLYLGAVKAVQGYTTTELHPPEIGDEHPATFAEMHPGIADELPTMLVKLDDDEIRHELPRRLGWLHPDIGDEMPVTLSDLHSPGMGGEVPVTLDSPPTNCWMFQHMVKSGGSTVRAMMSTWAAKENVKHDRYVDYMWLLGDDYAEMMLRKNSTYILGEYTESLRSYGGGRDCKWFTMFRHPIPRLVSAFFFCKPGGRGNLTHDPLCGHEAIDMETADLVDFAKHWGNYALRQFFIPYISQDLITSSPAAKECEKRIGTDTGLTCTVWNLVKLHLENATLEPSFSSSFSTNRRPIEEMALYPYLQAAQERLSNDYAAVGLLEDFGTSLRLFDATLGISTLNWVGMFKRSGRKNPAHAEQVSFKQEVLGKAWTDLTVRRYIALDLLLYDHVVAIHAKQVAEHGL